MFKLHPPCPHPSQFIFDRKGANLAAPPQLTENETFPQLLSKQRTRAPVHSFTEQSAEERAAPVTGGSLIRQPQGRKAGHPPRPFHLLRLLHPNPLMGFKVLRGGVHLVETQSSGQRWRPAPILLVDNGPQSLKLGCTLGIKYSFKTT